ncbi:hypothetical protein K7X08_002564 [Anisodus acutangulus]|uniref:Uncharacterized protein n=1 Tax=Anisodus acutangulus TaxID=402998 RepID=A0A9Q1LTR4_9SOLA|nr:hypothetical protein K7X08_002564 [Anisodus acutangulus]
MSQRSRRTNTEKGKATATSQPITKWVAPRITPSTNALEADEYVDDTPHFGHDVVEYHGYHKHMCRSNFKLEVKPARGEIDLEELQQQVWLAPHTEQFLGLAPPPSLPPDEDVNVVTKDDTYYSVDYMP